MNKQKLISMGVSDELAELIMKEISGSFIPKTRFDEVNELKKSYQEQLKERDSQLDELKKAVGDSDELKKQIESLQSENKSKDEKFNFEIKKMKIDNAIEKALTEAKAKNLKSVKALLDVENAELLEDGTIKGLSEKIKGLAENEETSFLFDSVDTPKTNGHSGFIPGQKKDGVPNDSSTYETRLAEARKNGNTLEAIRIKQEAINEGITLI